jgi:uncharacterized membrane protein YeiH
MRTLVLFLDLAGTFVFALAGATAGVRRGLDIFGILVLSFAAACSGGIARDVLIGATPPAAVVDWRYLAASAAAGLIAFRWHTQFERLAHPVSLFDAAGLALFAVAGAQKALAYDLSAVMAALLGMLTAIGGGLARDLLLARIPVVLRSEFYAVAALAGAAAVVMGDGLSLPPVATAVAGAGLCFGLRVAAIRRNWQLPKAFQEPPRTRRGTDARDESSDEREH